MDHVIIDGVRFVREKPQEPVIPPLPPRLAFNVTGLSCNSIDNRLDCCTVDVHGSGTTDMYTGQLFMGTPLPIRCVLRFGVPTLEQLRANGVHLDWATEGWRWWHPQFWQNRTTFWTSYPDVAAWSAKYTLLAADKWKDVPSEK